MTTPQRDDGLGAEYGRRFQPRAQSADGHPGARPAELEYPPGGLAGGFEWMHTLGFGRLDVEPCPRCGRAECPGDAGPSLDIEPEEMP